jgi:hypothetical protein
MLALLLGGTPAGKRLVANDDASLLFHAGSPVRVLGWPRSIGVRTDSAAAMDAWSPGFAARLGIDTSCVDGARTAHYLDHQLVAEATGAALATDCAVSLLVFPRFAQCTPGCAPRLRPLAPDEAYRRLVTTGLQDADGYDSFLDGVLPPGGAERVIRRWWPGGRVQVPAVELTQCLHGLAHTGRLLWDAAAVTRPRDLVTS